MNTGMLEHHAKTYLDVRRRGFIWVRCPDGRWKQDRVDAAKKFLMRFDESIQKLIKLRAKVLSPEARLELYIQEAVDNAKR